MTDVAVNNPLPTVAHEGSFSIFRLAQLKVRVLIFGVSGVVAGRESRNSCELSD
jgi:hypothetical protein